ncbi:MAG: hypothetical protein U0Q22_10310 [Acidimicrobiales bacterium]
MPRPIAIVTCAEGRPFDDDLDPLLAALATTALGDRVAVEVVDWDDPAVDWSRYELALVRSTWDYTQRHREFLEWTRRCGAATRLLNAPEVIAWNSDKRYLRDLEQAGIAVVPSTFVVSADEPYELPATGEFVVKPTVSAGSRDTIRYLDGDHAAARAHVDALVAAGRPTMIQPYQSAIDAEGETALLYFGGRFSHAVNKAPLLTAGEPATRALFSEEIITTTVARPDDVALADRCLAALGDVEALRGVDLPLPYARVDVLTGNDGRPAVLELELTEPSLFLGRAGDDGGAAAAAMFAGVIVGYLEGET